MKIHTSENLIERNAGVVLSPVQFAGKDARLDKEPIQVGDGVILEATDNVTIRVVIESIGAGKFIGRILSFCGAAGDADEYMGMQENELIEFEERYVLDFARVN